jgi:DNA repair photolyase
MPELVRRDLDDWPREEPVHVGSRCDPYMPLEGRYRLTRNCLIALSELRIPCYVCTKSDPDIISRDLDIMKNYQAKFIVVLGLSNLNQIENAESCSRTKNIEFARRLHTLGIEVWAFIMPVLPEITDVHAMIEAIPEEISIWLFKLQANADTISGRRLIIFIKKKYPHLIQLYENILQGEDDVYFQDLKDDLIDNPRINFPYG